MATQCESETQRVEVGGLVAVVYDFENDFSLSIQDTKDEREPELRLRAGSGGYQLDLFWDGDEKRKQSNNWVKFGDQSMQYPHDNEHPRDPEISPGEGETAQLVIHDPDPRAANAGYGGADIVVERHEDGFRVEIQWEDEMGEEQRYAVVAPFFDPRVNPMVDDDTTEREAYYEYMVPLVDTTSDEGAGE